MRYYFVTICYGEYIDEILQELHNLETDIIVMNSCLWDIHRYGLKGVNDYENNLLKLVKELRRYLPDCLFIWLTTPPVDLKSKGGFLMIPGQDLVRIKEVKRCNNIARATFIEANKFDRRFRVVDLDYVFQYFVRHRASDGVHWNEKAHRRMSNMILEEVAKAFNKSVPRILQEDPAFAIGPHNEQEDFANMWNGRQPHPPNHQLASSFHEGPRMFEQWDMRNRDPAWAHQKEQWEASWGSHDNSGHSSFAGSPQYDRFNSPMFPRGGGQQSPFMGRGFWGGSPGMRPPGPPGMLSLLLLSLLQREQLGQCFS